MSNRWGTDPVISRRQFLKQSSVAALLAQVGWTAPPLDAPFRARCFASAPVYEKPGGSLIGHLAQDSIHAVWDAGSAFYRMEFGYIPKTMMQPMLDLRASPPLTAIDPHRRTVAELVAPSTSVRNYADGNAPETRRLGHGTSIEISDVIKDQHNHTWYEIAPGEWVDAGHFSLWHPSMIRVQSAVLRVSRRALTVTLLIDHNLILVSGYSGILSSAAGVYPIMAFEPTAWTLIAQDFRIRAACDHNCFGVAGGPPQQVELPVQAVRTLYALMLAGQETSIVIED